MNSRLGKLPFYYGWVIVAVSFITLGIAFGVWYSFSVFYVAILKDFGWNRASTAGIFSLFTITHYFCALAAGSFIDRFGPRLTIPIGALWLAGVLTLLATVKTILGFYLVYGILAALGVSLIGFVTHASFLPRWFQRRRGLALGIAMSGIGIGMLILPPTMQHLIDIHDWRFAYRTLAIIVLLVIPINLFFQRRDPSLLGLRPDGDPPGEELETAIPEQPRNTVQIIDPDWDAIAWTSRKAIATRRFWFLVGGFFWGPFAIQGVLLHAVAGMVAGGLTAARAAAVFGILGVFGSIGKITLGFSGDRWNRETAHTIGMAAASLGVLALAGTNLKPHLLPWLFAISFGFGYGAVAPIFPAIAADIFQGSHFGRIFGLLSLSLGFGGAAGAWFSGFIFDLTGSYHIAFAFDIAALWLSCAFFWLAAPRKIRLSQPLRKTTG
ncbi:MAG: MFS transporter [Deltaproteobacteria bacterium]|nr:MFS transporter [Deltaproteobacteria bacterium]